MTFMLPRHDPGGQGDPMKRVLCALVLVSAFLVAALPGTARAAANCAFQDVDDNGVFNLGDVQVLDSQWAGGTAFVSEHPFVVPVGCEVALPSVPFPSKGVSVTATKITFLGRLLYLQVGGTGVVLNADPAAVLSAGKTPQLGDGSIAIGNGSADNVRIQAGGYNLLPASAIAVYRKSIAIIGTGNCSINKATLFGNSPIQDTRVGVLCTGDLMLRSATIIGSRVNIQSVNGKIDAQSSAAPTGPNLADACDVAGNNNGFLDAGDFPCQLTLSGQTPVFQNAAELEAFCKDPQGGRNIIQAFNDPLIIIAKNELDVSGAPTGGTELLGRYRVEMGSETGNVNTAHALIHHGSLPNPGAAKIWVFADPVSIVRLPVDREDFLGPSSGTINIESACYVSPSPVQVGKDAVNAIHLVGTPDPVSPGQACRQVPGGFVGVLNGIF
jgi:hypothetical protein